MRKKAGSDDQVPALAESAIFFKAFCINWARLIRITGMQSKWEPSPQIA
jgi:hypothetical protein